MSDENKELKLTPDLFVLVPIDASELEKISRPSMTFWQDARRRIMANKGSRFAMFILVFLVLMSIFAPMLNSYTYKEQIDPIRDHYKLPPRIPIIENIGLLDGTRTLEVGENGFAAYEEGEYVLLKEWMEYDSQRDADVQKYKIKELTYSMQNIPDEYYWFGTDELGRDQWTRIWTGTQLSLFIGLLAALIDFLIGVSFGAIAGYFGGKVDML
ncbi:MAG: hypothetical protein PF505_08860, partial [Vallitaleaceae bacterium]|nr:hypothetical protein [Vallitaleaceae bacterium]